MNEVPIWGPRRSDSRGLKLCTADTGEVEVGPMVQFLRYEGSDAESDSDWLTTAEPLQALWRVDWEPEPPARWLPEAPQRHPSDRRAHALVLERFRLLAHGIATEEAYWPLLHGRFCLCGLYFVSSLRFLAYCCGSVPGPVLFGIHWLTCSSDAISLIAATPIFIQGTTGRCVQLGCIGPMLTLVFSMCLADVGALVAYLTLAAPRPLLQDRSLLDFMRAHLGSWEFLLVASVALELALCLCSWRIFRELRLTGLYPPGKKPLGLGPVSDVSVFELICEADDAHQTSLALSKHCSRASRACCSDDEIGVLLDELRPEQPPAVKLP